MGMVRLAQGLLRRGKAQPEGTGIGEVAGSASEVVQREHPGPLLALDIGSTYTRAGLFDWVDGRHRMLAIGQAPTTLRGWSVQVLDPIREAITEIEQVTNRQLLSSNGTILSANTGQGVEAVVATASGHLRLVVVGLTKSFSTESARRAASGLNSLVLATVSLDSAGSESSARLQALCRRIRVLQPDAILIAGGTEKGASQPIIDFVEALAADGDRHLPGERDETSIIFSGNSQAATVVKGLLGDKYDLRLVPNLRPSLEAEDLGPTRVELRQVWQRALAARLPGMATLETWLSCPLRSTIEGFVITLRFLAHFENARVLGLDVGGLTTSIIVASGDDFSAYSREPWGVGSGASEIVGSPQATDGATSVEPPVINLANAALNKWSRPWSVPETEAEMLAEMALARAALCDSWERGGFASLFAQPSLRRTIVVVRGGVFSHCQDAVLALLAIVDSIGPTGLIEIGVDSGSILPQLGVLATLYPQAAAEAVLTDGLERLCTWVGSVGKATADAKVPVFLECANGLTERRWLPFGSMAILPLKHDERAYLSVGPCNDLDFGAGRGRRARVPVRGGRLGVVVDVRGSRPSDMRSHDWVGSTAQWLSGFRAAPAALVKGVDQ